MSYSIEVENIKCGGCAGTIKTKISALDGVDDVSVAIEEGVVAIEGSAQHKTAVATELLRLGYPETGTTEGIKAVAAKAKSFVSCAVGRLDSDD